MIIKIATKIIKKIISNNIFNNIINIINFLEIKKNLQIGQKVIYSFFAEILINL